MNCKLLIFIFPFLFCCDSHQNSKNYIKPLKTIETITMLGDTLRSPNIKKGKTLDQFKLAQANYFNNKNDPEALIWYGRRTAYMGYYKEAIKLFTQGVNTFPNDARFYRHRGHRYISTRQYDNAISDFQIAVKLIDQKKDQIEPDGLPNKKNIPLSSLHGNIWYHLGLVYYLKNDMNSSLKAFKNRSVTHKYDDNIVSGDCDCICYFGGGIYVDESSWPIIGGSITLGNTFENNIADYGMELYRGHSDDSSNWTPIYAHHNTFENCPPEFPAEVYPQNGWDLDNCHSLFVKNNDVMSPDAFLIYPNFPNPFNSSTNLQIFLNNKGSISVTIFNLKGETIENILIEDLDEGINYFKWKPNGIPSGVYFIKSSFNDYIQTQKVLFVK